MTIISSIYGSKGMNDFWKCNFCYNFIKKNWNIRACHEDQYEIIKKNKKISGSFTPLQLIIHLYIYITCRNFLKS
jgi:hypothetical protein